MTIYFQRGDGHVITYQSDGDWLFSGFVLSRCVLIRHLPTSKTARVTLQDFDHPHGYVTIACSGRVCVVSTTERQDEVNGMTASSHFPGLHFLHSPAPDPYNVTLLVQRQC